MTPKERSWVTTWAGISALLYLKAFTLGPWPPVGWKALNIPVAAAFGATLVEIVFPLIVGAVGIVLSYARGRIRRS